MSRYDNLMGDEFECFGHCGLCEHCEEHYLNKCDEEYEKWSDEQL